MSFLIFWEASYWNGKNFESIIIKEQNQTSSVLLIRFSYLQCPWYILKAKNVPQITFAIRWNVGIVYSVSSWSSYINELSFQTACTVLHLTPKMQYVLFSESHCEKYQNVKQLLRDLFLPGFTRSFKWALHALVINQIKNNWSTQSMSVMYWSIDWTLV